MHNAKRENPNAKKLNALGKSTISTAHLPPPHVIITIDPNAVLQTPEKMQTTIRTMNLMTAWNGWRNSTTASGRKKSSRRGCGTSLANKRGWIISRATWTPILTSLNVGNLME